MKVMVLGTKKIAFVNKEGEEIRGLKLFYGWENPEDPNLSGMETADCFLTEAKTPKKDLAVGTEATIYYNRFGKVDAVIVD